MRPFLTVLFLMASCSSILAQISTAAIIDDLNRAIDHAVVDRDFVKLRESYADDFVFTHGTGLVDSKESWLLSIQKSTDEFLSREHDSTSVELHGEVAILTGKLRVSKLKGSLYAIKYIRVYALRKEKWLLVSHRTIQERHY